MDLKISSDFVTVRAQFKSFIALSAIWVILAVANLYLYFVKHVPDSELVVLLTGTIALLWWIWLRGFKLTISGGELEYRDGFFKSSRVSIKDIVDIKNKYIEWNVITRKIKIPRIFIIAQNGNVAIKINPQPFGRNLQIILKKLKNSRSDEPGF